MNSIQTEDCQSLGKLDFIDWDQFKNSTILITGSTGLIGVNLVNAIAYNGREKKLNIRLILPVRDTKKAEKLFARTDADIVHYTLGTELTVQEPVDYIVHLASPTSSKFFVEHPVDTLIANIEGTKALLDWAKDHKVKKFISLSSMEVYGFPGKGQKVKEKELGSFETMSARNSYPIAKIASEALSYSYHTQYAVPIVILRATQTFGPGVQYQDGRVFAEFMRCAIEKKDIVLKSAGLTERSYLYTRDAVSAIIVAMLRGEPGEAYSVANSQTYCSIKEMAELVACKVAHGKIKVKFDLAEDVTKLGYADTLYMDLDDKKIKKLGWYPTVDLQEMFERMIRGLAENE